MTKATHGNIHNTYGSKDKGHSFSDNLPKLTTRFPISPNGFFGKPGQGKARIIECNNPLNTAMAFYLVATEGAIRRAHLRDAQKVPKPGTEFAIMKDGSRIQIRYKSGSDGSPVVDIFLTNIGYVKSQKIHFVRKKKK